MNSPEKRASSTEQRNSNMSSITDSLAREHAFGERPWKQAVKRGFFGKCPACGNGKIFKSYLKVNDTCPNCGEELHHQRADDAPPYVTIFVVGHIVGALILAVEERYTDFPLWIHATLWPTLALILCLTLLPAFKGALIALQWALRMHGFQTATPPTVPQKAIEPAAV